MNFQLELFIADRTDNGLTQREEAELLGVHSTEICMIESGTRVPTPRHPILKKKQTFMVDCHAIILV